MQFSNPDLSQKKVLYKIRRYLQLCGAKQEFINEFLCGFCSGLSSLWLYSRFLSHSTEDKSHKSLVQCDDAEWFWQCIYVLSEWDETDISGISRLVDPFINKIHFLQYAKFMLNNVNQNDFEYIVSDTKNRKFIREFTKIVPFNNYQELKKYLEVFNKAPFLLLKISALDHEFALVKNGGNYIIYDPNSINGEFISNDLEIIAKQIIKILQSNHNPNVIAFSSFHESTKPKINYAFPKVTSANLERYSDKFLQQIIFCCAVYGDYELAQKVLISQRVDINLLEVNHSHALDVAAQNNYAQIVSLLLDYGANPHITNKYGYNSWMLSIAHGSLDVVKVFVEKGVITSESLGREQNPFQLAELSLNQEVSEYLSQKLLAK